MVLKSYDISGFLSSVPRLDKTMLINEYERPLRTRPMIRTYNLEPYHRDIEAGLAALAKDRVVPRIFEKDGSVWPGQAGDIANRLGWLTSPLTVETQWPDIRTFVDSARRSGLDRTLLVGMGGSSLAPLVLASVFRTRRGYLDLEILDSTDPGAVARAQKAHPPRRTLFIVSSKSGTTAETNSFFRYFWNKTRDAVGEAAAPQHFAAITDPGTPLEAEARRLGFRRVFSGDPEIGGRFSALSPFCLVPAALKGVRVRELGAEASQMARLCGHSKTLRGNPGAFLGTILGVLAGRGLDKLTLLLPPRLETFGLWLEQLVAESTGKGGRGILPVTGKAVGPPADYGTDRLFVAFGRGADAARRAPLDRLVKAGRPLLSLDFSRASELGGQFFLWEFATAVAGRFLGINPFDQPDVESSKKRTKELLGVYRQTGSLPEDRARSSSGGVSVFTDADGESLGECLRAFLAGAEVGGYIAIQAFLPPGERTASALRELGRKLRAMTGLATTVGFGPRFLHSTGQLHKGDAGRGLFVQITAGGRRDAAIPDEPGSAESAVTFGVLEAAQARGDAEALRSAGRRVLRFDLDGDVRAGLRALLSLVG